MADLMVATIVDGWPHEARRAAQLVIDAYGEPHESCLSSLTWYRPGPWKRIVASKVSYDHQFPAPHIDSIQSFIDYQVRPDRVRELAEFDGSVVVDRTAGEVSVRCHDEQANFLALNLVHDIAIGHRTVAAARAYYAKEFVDQRRGLPTPYMAGLRFESRPPTAAPDRRVLSDEDLQRAVAEGAARQAR